MNTAGLKNIVSSYVTEKKKTNKTIGDYIEKIKGITSPWVSVGILSPMFDEMKERGRCGGRATSLQTYILDKKLSYTKSDQDTPERWVGNQKWRWSSGRAHGVSKQIDVDKAKNLMKKCDKMCKGEAVEGIKSKWFSLFGANIALGTNCVNFAQELIRTEGVEVGWFGYTASFISPWLSTYGKIK